MGHKQKAGKYGRGRFEEMGIDDIPEDWRIVKMGDIVSFKNGINFESLQKGDSGVLTLDVKNMYSDDLEPNLDSLYRVDKEVNQESLLEEGDVLIVRSSVKKEGIGWTTCFQEYVEPVTYCGFIIRARITTDNIIPKFLTYILRSSLCRRQIVRRSGQVAITNISQKSLSNILIPLPSLDTQEKIVDILQAATQLVSYAKMNIETISRLKRRVMQRLLTLGIGHTRFKKTKIGEIPESWHLRTLGEICLDKPNYGANTPAMHWEKGLVRYVRITDIAEDGRLLDSDFKSLDASLAENYLLEEGDLVFARTGSVGKTHLHDTRNGLCAFAGYLIRFRPDKSMVRPDFLFHYTHSEIYYRWVFRIKRLGVQSNINASEYSNLLIPVPPMNEQNEICEVLNNVNTSIENNQKQQEMLELLKKGLMQVLLTGKVRVPF